MLSETTPKTERSVARAMAEAILDEGYISSTSTASATTAAAMCPPVRSSVSPHHCPVKENGKRKVALLGDDNGDGVICLAVNALKCATAAAAAGSSSGGGGGGGGGGKSNSGPVLTSLAPPPMQTTARGWPQSELAEPAPPAPGAGAVHDGSPSVDACSPPTLRGEAAAVAAKAAAPAAAAVAAAGAVLPSIDFTATGATRVYGGRGVDAPFGHAIIIEEHVQAVAAVRTTTPTAAAAAAAVAVVVDASPSPSDTATVSVELAEEVAVPLPGSSAADVDRQPVGCGETAATAANGRARIVQGLPTIRS